MEQTWITDDDGNSCASIDGANEEHEMETDKEFEVWFSEYWDKNYSRSEGGVNAMMQIMVRHSAEQAWGHIKESIRTTQEG